MRDGNVKAWFAGSSDVSPVVADFAASGFNLVGGSRLPADRDINGYHLVFWQAGDLTYGAVSDTGIDELRSLENLMRAVSTGGSS